eukprot:7267939-Karenia_brevis.AAC.1
MPGTDIQIDLDTQLISECSDLLFGFQRVFCPMIQWAGISWRRIRPRIIEICRHQRCSSQSTLKDFRHGRSTASCPGPME